MFSLSPGASMSGPVNSSSAAPLIASGEYRPQPLLRKTNIVLSLKNVSVLTTLFVMAVDTFPAGAGFLYDLLRFLWSAIKFGGEWSQEINCVTLTPWISPVFLPAALCVAYFGLTSYPAALFFYSVKETFDLFFKQRQGKFSAVAYELILLALCFSSALLMPSFAGQGVFMLAYMFTGKMIESIHPLFLWPALIITWLSNKEGIKGQWAKIARVFSSNQKRIPLPDLQATPSDDHTQLLVTAIEGARHDALRAISLMTAREFNLLRTKLAPEASRVGPTGFGDSVKVRDLELHEIAEVIQYCLNVVKGRTFAMLFFRKVEPVCCSMFMGFLWNLLKAFIKVALAFAMTFAAVFGGTSEVVKVDLFGYMANPFLVTDGTVCAASASGHLIDTSPLFEGSAYQITTAWLFNFMTANFLFPSMIFLMAATTSLSLPSKPMLKMLAAAAAIALVLGIPAILAVSNLGFAITNLVLSDFGNLFFIRVGAAQMAFLLAAVYGAIKCWGTRKSLDESVDDAFTDVHKVRQSVTEDDASRLVSGFFEHLVVRASSEGGLSELDKQALSTAVELKDVQGKDPLVANTWSATFGRT